MSSPVTNGSMHHSQRGAMTIFSAILILFLMTVALLYSTRNSVFDQRVSANELRNRVAFNMAEASANVMVEYIVANSATILDANLWTQCAADLDICAKDLPEPARVDSAFYASDVGSSLSEVEDAIGALNSSASDADATNDMNATAKVSLARQYIVEGEAGDEGDANVQSIFMIYGYGFSDCTDVTDIDTCKGRASVAVPLSTFSALAGSPKVPLTSKSLVNGIGAMTVVGNPNAGGVGVPVTVWANDSDGAGGVTDGNGTWQTCEWDDWYETASLPEDETCPVQGANGCTCTQEESLSYAVGGSTYKNIDILEDTNFPDDLFLTYFGVPRTNYEVIKNAAKIIPNCNSLDANSSGIYWSEGDCAIQNGTVGSSDKPVVLVAAGSTNQFNGGTLFGVVFVTDVENADCEFTANGNNIVYGAMVIDCFFDKMNGTFDLVYADGVLGRANGLAGVGAANGGWRDFDVPAFTAAVPVTP